MVVEEGLGSNIPAELISIDPLQEYSVQPLCLCWGSGAMSGTK